MMADAGEKQKRLVLMREGVFRIPQSADEKPALVACRCPQCGQFFFPRRVICLACGHQGLGEALLSSRGRIYTFTIARQTPPGSLVQAPYVVAQVELPEKVIVPSVLSDCDVDSVRIGMEVEMVLEKVKEDDEGNDVVAYKFKLV